MALHLQKNNNLSHFVIQGSTYHISAIVPNGAGQYLCAAVNNVPPSASYIVNVDVQFRPVCVALIDRVRPDPDGMQKTTLTCIVSGNLLYEITKMENLNI